MIYSAGGTYEDASSPSTTVYNPLTGASTTIRNDAHGSSQITMYEIGNDGYVKDVGKLHVSGIHTFIYDCAHEATHRQYFTDGTDKSWNVFYHAFRNNPNATTPDQDPTGDWDGDGLTNAWEIAHHLNPEESDTASDFSGASYGDSEVYATIGGYGVLAQHKDDWKLDWANDGLQWGNWFATDLSYNPSYVAPVSGSYHPWFFLGISFGRAVILPDPPGLVLSAMSN